MRTGLHLVGATIAAMTLSASIGGADGEFASRSNNGGGRIEEAAFVPLGGVDQYVTIRGDDRSNPVLLHVHGGPGTAFSAFTNEFAAFEAEFTVVQWDQRGAGCTFSRNRESTPELTLDRIAADGIELAKYLRNHLDGSQIIVFGHSFGSVVAIDMVRREPQNFDLYIGAGQFGSFRRTVDAQLLRLRRLAAASPEVTAQLDTLATLDSQSLQKFGGLGRLLPAYMPPVDVAVMRGLPARAAELMGAEELSDWQTARQATMSSLIQQISGVDLPRTANRIEVPFLLIQGSDDLITPADAATEYFEQVEAPLKEIVVIDGAGHFPHLTHTTEFLSALRSRVVRML